MKTEDAYKQKMAAQLKEWSAQIELFEAKVENAGADVKVRRAEELDRLRAQQRTASEKMQDLEKATGEAWKQVKTTADKVWADLKTGMAEAHAKYK